MLRNYITELVAFLKAKTHSSSLSIDSLKKLSGGAIQENWLLNVSILDGDYSGQHEWVLRCDSSTSLTDSLSREQEFVLLQKAYAASVTVAKPLWLGDVSVFGKSFFVMHKVDGVTRPAHLTDASKFKVDRDKLVSDLACELAKIHSIEDSEELDFLKKPNIHPAKFGLDQYSQYLNSLTEMYPVLEWTIRYMQENPSNFGRFSFKSSRFSRRKFNGGRDWFDGCFRLGIL